MFELDKLSIIISFPVAYTKELPSIAKPALLEKPSLWIYLRSGKDLLEAIILYKVSLLTIVFVNSKLNIIKVRKFLICKRRFLKRRWVGEIKMVLKKGSK